MGVEASRASLWSDLKAAARPLAAGLAAGFLAGLVIGGLGGRLAMLLLRLTSDPGLHGLQTDDGFTIGIVSTATLFLFAVTAILGAIGGILYLVVRSWLPRGARQWVFGALAGAVGGALVLRPGGIDFTALDPLPLAVAMFIAIPAAYGFAVSLLVERYVASERAFRGWGIWLVAFALLFLPLFGPIGIAIAATITLLFVAIRLSPEIGSLWRSAPVVWLGRAALAIVGAVALVDLVGDVAEIL